jgi:hypothetical protein
VGSRALHEACNLQAAGAVLELEARWVVYDGDRQHIYLELAFPPPIGSVERYRFVRERHEETLRAYAGSPLIVLTTEALPSGDLPEFALVVDFVPAGSVLEWL